VALRADKTRGYGSPTREIVLAILQKQLRPSNPSQLASALLRLVVCWSGRPIRDQVEAGHGRLSLRLFGHDYFAIGLADFYAASHQRHLQKGAAILFQPEDVFGSFEIHRGPARNQISQRVARKFLGIACKVYENDHARNVPKVLRAIHGHEPDTRLTWWEAEPRLVALGSLRRDHRLTPRASKADGSGKPARLQRQRGPWISQGAISVPSRRSYHASATRSGESHAPSGSSPR